MKINKVVLDSSVFKKKIKKSLNETVQLRTLEASVCQTAGTAGLFLSCLPEPSTSLTAPVKPTLLCSVKEVVHTFYAIFGFVGFLLEEPFLKETNTQMLLILESALAIEL